MREKLFNRANRESRYTAARNAPKARAENSSIFFRMVICGICGDRGILGRANRGSFTCLYRKFEKNLSPSKPLGAQLALQSRGDDERNYDSIGNRMHREVKRASRNFSNRAEGPRPPAWNSGAVSAAISFQRVFLQDVPAASPGNSCARPALTRVRGERGT